MSVLCDFQHLRLRKCLVVVFVLLLYFGFQNYWFGIPPIHKHRHRHHSHRHHRHRKPQQQNIEHIHCIARDPSPQRLHYHGEQHAEDIPHQEALPPLQQSPPPKNVDERNELEQCVSNVMRFVFSSLTPFSFQFFSFNQTESVEKAGEEMIPPPSKSSSTALDCEDFSEDSEVPCFFYLTRLISEHQTEFE